MGPPTRHPHAPPGHRGQEGGGGGQEGRGGRCRAPAAGAAARCGPRAPLAAAPSPRRGRRRRGRGRLRGCRRGQAADRCGRRGRGGGRGQTPRLRRWPDRRRGSIWRDRSGRCGAERRAPTPPTLRRPRMLDESLGSLVCRRGGRGFFFLEPTHVLVRALEGSLGWRLRSRVCVRRHVHRGLPIGKEGRKEDGAHRAAYRKPVSAYPPQTA